MKILATRANARMVAVTTAVTVALGAGAALSADASGTSVRAAKVFSNRVFASAAKLTHSTSSGSQALSGPDDITSLKGHIFVGFQNGVGAQGEASTTGNKDSTVVEFTGAGRALKQWDLIGKCDGLTADPALGRVIATVNEDGNSSAYLINSASTTPAHFTYSRTIPSNGGTDAITIYRGMILVSASAPGTKGAAAPNAKYPAFYRVVFHAASHVATITSGYSDEAKATVANGSTEGKTVRLALVDPDSSEVVPAYAHRFAGDFMLTSQGDQQQIFARGVGTGHESVSVLDLSQAVDDTAWASGSSGALYITDASTNTIDKVTGPFTRGSVFTSVTPCDAGNAPSTCPGHGFPDNYLGALNPNTGKITRVAVIGPTLVTKSMMFLP